MFWKRIIVGFRERIVVAKNGRFHAMLAPGKYRIFVLPGVSLEMERHDLRDLVFQSRWADYLISERPEVAERHFMRVETNDVQVGMVYVNGELFKVLAPAKRVLFWRGQAEVTAELVNVIAEPEISPQNLDDLERMLPDSFATMSAIEEELEI